MKLVLLTDWSLVQPKAFGALLADPGTELRLKGQATGHPKDITDLSMSSEVLGVCFQHKLVLTKNNLYKLRRMSDQQYVFNRRHKFNLKSFSFNQEQVIATFLDLQKSTSL